MPEQYKCGKCGKTSPTPEDVLRGPHAESQLTLTTDARLAGSCSWTSRAGAFACVRPRICVKRTEMARGSPSDERLLVGLLRGEANAVEMLVERYELALSDRRK